MLEALEPRQVLSTLPFAAGNTLVEVQTNYGNIWIEMFDSTTPLTVQNFLQYVNADRYDGTFIHRHAQNFVLQGGGYELNMEDVTGFVGLPGSGGVVQFIASVGTSLYRADSSGQVSTPTALSASIQSLSRVPGGTSISGANPGDIVACATYATSGKWAVYRVDDPLGTPSLVKIGETTFGVGSLTFGSDGIYAVDDSTSPIQVRKLSSSDFSVVQSWSTGVAAAGSSGIAFDQGNSRFLITDSANNRLLNWTPGNNASVVGGAGFGFNSNGIEFVDGTLYGVLRPAAASETLRFGRFDTSSGTFTALAVATGVEAIGAPQHIETFSAVQNEYLLSNLPKTVAMAKQGGDPNSATSEFFFNLADNSGNLNNQNGGFTVFGQVVNGWDVVLKITALEIVNAGSPYDTLPVRENYTGGTITDIHLVKINDVRVISSPGWSQEAKADAVVRGAGSAQGQSLFITNNELGRPIIFHQASSSAAWTVSDLSLQSGAPTITGKLTAWFDTNDSRFYASAPSAAGLLLFTRATTGFWTVRNLGTEIATSQIVNSDVSVFTSTDGLNHVAGTTSTGQLVIFSQTSSKDTSGNYTWTFANIATRDLIPNGKTMPTWVGDITTYVTSWNGLNVAGLDASGKIQVVWWAPGLTAWTTDNLSDLTGAPNITGSLTSYLTSWGGINLAGTDSNGKLNVTWWVPGSNWVTNNLTDQFSGPALVTTSLSSYVTPWGGLNIAGTDSNGEINVYWWSPGMTDWVVTNLSDITTGAVAPSGRMTGVASPAGTINLVGKAASGEVLRYYWNPGDGGTWTFLNMTTTASFY